MPKSSSKLSIPALVEHYKNFTQAYYLARNNDDFNAQKTSSTRVKKIIEEIDSFGSEGRLALIPLLDDADQGIRTFTAADLVRVIPERALSVLREIARGPTYFPRITAGNFLDSYAKGKWPA